MAGAHARILHSVVRATEDVTCAMAAAQAQISFAEGVSIPFLFLADLIRSKEISRDRSRRRRALAALGGN